MNAYIDDKPTSANLDPDVLLDWKVDIDRISRRAREHSRRKLQTHGLASKRSASFS